MGTKISIDGDGERGGSYQFKPRFRLMRHYESGDELTFPLHHIADEGTCVQWNMSNLALEEISDLFPKVIRAIIESGATDLNERYLTAPTGGSILSVESDRDVAKNRHLARSDQYAFRVSVQSRRSVMNSVRTSRWSEALVRPMFIVPMPTWETPSSSKRLIRSRHVSGSRSPSLTRA